MRREVELNSEDGTDAYVDNHRDSCESKRLFPEVLFIFPFEIQTSAWSVG